MNKVSTLKNLSLDQKRKLLKNLINKDSKNEGIFPLTYQQNRLWFFNELEEIKSIYNIPYSINLDGILDVEKLIKIINDIVKSHSALRTRFIDLQGKAYQQVLDHIEVEVPIIDLNSVNRLDKQHKTDAIINKFAKHIFDLRNGPLFKFKILKLGLKKHILLINFHHIISDGASVEIFLKELVERYSHLNSNNHKSISKYSNYSKRQRDIDEDHLLLKLAYWKKKLSKSNFLLDLPFDKKRNNNSRFEGAMHSFQIPQMVIKSLGDIAKSYKTTMNTIILSAFNVLLYKYTKQKEILIGVPVSLRTSEDLEQVFGFFVNTLVLKSEISNNTKFLDLLEQCRKEMLNSLENREVPFDRLVDELKIKRDPAYNPIFQVMFSYERTLEHFELPELILEPKVIPNDSSKFDLTLNIYEGNTEIKADFEYNTNLFTPETIKRITIQFLNLLNCIASDPQKQISNLTLLDEKTELEVLNMGNHNIIEQEEDNYTVINLLKKASENNPSKIAIASGEQFITYDELDKKSNQLANYLIHNGIKKETLIGIYMDKSLDTFISMVAILKAGGAYIPLDPKYPSERISFMISDTNLEYIITKNDYLKDLYKYKVQNICINHEEILNQKVSSPKVKIDLNQLAYVIYTSGTTGKPKGVMVEHKSISSIANAWFEEFNLEHFEVRILQMANQSFDVFTGDLVKSFVSGGTLIICPEEIKLDFQKLHEFIIKYNITLIETTPALILPFLDYINEENLILINLKLLIIGSDILLANDFQKITEEFGSNIKIINSYGITEATIDSSFYYFEPTKKPLNQLSNTPIGKPLKNTKFYILDDQLNLQDVGIIGELYIGGAAISRGYINNIELTNQKFLVSPFNNEMKLYKTGDLARWNHDGDLEIIGRSDNQVKIGGYRIELGEIEEVLKKHPFVIDAAVICSQNQTKRLEAFIVIKGNDSFSTLEKLIKNFLKDSLPFFMIPSMVKQVEFIPQTPNGKVNRKYLENISSHSIEMTSKKNRYELLTESLPRTILEYELQNIWKDILNLETIRLMDNFFDIGGNSILLVQLLSKIRKKYSINIALPMFYKNATIEELATIIKNEETENQNSFITCIQPKGTKPPVFVFHQTGGHWFRYLELVKHLGAEHPVYALGTCNPYGDSDNLVVIASLYLKEIKKIQPYGPYTLIGHSFGGNIAFEIGLQLENAGEEVEYLALFDTYLPPHRESVTDFEIMLEYMDRYKLNEKDIHEFKNMSYNQKLEYMLVLGRKYGYLPMDLDIQEMDRILTVNIKLHRALITYKKPKNKYKGNVHFFRAMKETVDSTNGWAEYLSGKLFIHEINSTHGVMLTEPYIIQIADIIKDVID